MRHAGRSRHSRSSNRKKPADIRERELRKAAEQLGIEVYFMGYPDGGLANMEPGMLLETITCWIDMVQPQLILTFGPEGVSGHPDHVIISKIVTQAYDQCCQKGLLLFIRPSDATVLGCGVSSTVTDEDQPLVKIDISDYKLDKIRAIQSHASQNPGLPGRPEEEMDKIPCMSFSPLLVVLKQQRITRIGSKPNRDERQ